MFFLVEENNPHLIILDLMLPGIEGVELMQQIAAKRDLPVIFVSAYGQDQLVARAFELGADDYVVKALLTNRVSCTHRGSPAKTYHVRTASALCPGKPDHRL